MSRAPAIDLGYRPRPQFEAFHTRRQRWACIVAHRRAGKTVACIMDLLDAALRCSRPDPRFAYIGPTYTQAKDVAWAYLKQFSAALPRVVSHETELRVDLPNRGRVRLYGAENYDRLRGLYLDGVVLDEYADMDPRVWPEVIRPALSDRQGWAVFIGTPKGHNDFHAIHQRAAADPEWFSSVLRASDTEILEAGELADARRALTADQYAQEYGCSFDAAIVGAYWGAEMRQALEENRIAAVPHDRAVPVWTGWDLGVGDQTAIWFAQIVGREVHLIDYYEASGQALDHYVAMLKSKPYVYEEHLLPHDAAARELGTGKTRVEMLAELGVSARIVPRQNVDDGIAAVRLALSRCWFDTKACERGIEALRLYRCEWDERNRVLKPRPVHDWASHGADALRCLVMGVDEQRSSRSKAWGKPDRSWVV